MILRLLSRWLVTRRVCDRAVEAALRFGYEMGRRQARCGSADAVIAEAPDARPTVH